MKRLLFLFLLLSVCTSCTVMIVPHSRTGHGRSVVYMAVTEDDASAKPTVTDKTAPSSGPYLGLSTGQQVESAACMNLQEPSYSPVPPMTPLTTVQRQDKILVENALVDYILNLRAYIAGVIDTSNKFYTNYATSCKNVAQPPIK